jgi:hypothetical protein
MKRSFFSSIKQRIANKKVIGKVNIKSNGFRNTNLLRKVVGLWKLVAMRKDNFKRKLAMQYRINQL